MSGGGGASDEGVESEVSEEVDDWDVVYKAPCGLSLRNYDDVMRFLLASDSYDILQVSWFRHDRETEIIPCDRRSADHC